MKEIEIVDSKTIRITQPFEVNIEDLKKEKAELEEQVRQDENFLAQFIAGQTSQINYQTEATNAKTAPLKERIAEIQADLELAESKGADLSDVVEEITVLDPKFIE